MLLLGPLKVVIGSNVNPTGTVSPGSANAMDFAPSVLPSCVQDSAVCTPPPQPSISHVRPIIVPKSFSN